MNDVIVSLKGMNYLQSIGIRREQVDSPGSSLLLLPFLALGLGGPRVGGIAHRTLTGTSRIWTGRTETGVGQSWTFFKLLVLRLRALLPSPEGNSSLPFRVISLINQGIIQILNTNMFATEIKNFYNETFLFLESNLTSTIFLSVSSSSVISLSNLERMKLN